MGEDELAAQLIGLDPVLARRAEDEARTQGAAALRWLIPMLGRDPYESVPRVARLVADCGDSALQYVSPLLGSGGSDEQQARGVAAVFRFHASSEARAVVRRYVEAGQVATGPWPALEAVGELGDADIAEQLVGDLRRGRDTSRDDSAVNALERTMLAQQGRAGAEQALNALVDLLSVSSQGAFSSDPAWTVFRWRAGWIDVSVQRVLEQPTVDARLRERAPAWLGRARVARAVTTLGHIAADPSEQIAVRIAAVRALGEGDLPGALQAVAAAATDSPEDPAFLTALDGALARLALQSADAAALATDVLARATTARNVDAQAEALRALGALRADSGLVRAALLDSDGYVRGAAALALTEIGDPGAVASAREEASEPMEQLQMAAAAAWLDEPGAGDALHAALCELPPSLRALWALRPTLKQAILRGFRTTDGPESERLMAWQEVLAVGDDAVNADSGATAAPDRSGRTEDEPLAGAASTARPSPRLSRATVGEPTPVAAPMTPPSSSAVAADPAVAPPSPPTTATTATTPRRGRRRTPRPGGGGYPSSQADEAAEIDLLGRSPMVNVLAAMLDDEHQGTPFAFALFGSWGAGKSSVLRQLKKQLVTERSHTFVITEFNAWAYENTDSVAAALVQETVRAIVPDARGWGRIGRFRFRLRYGWQAHAPRLVWLVLVLAASLAAAIYGLILGTREDSIAKILLGTGGLTVFSLIGTMAVQLYRHPVSTEVLTYFRLPDYGAQVGPLQKMRDELAALWRLKQQRLVAPRRWWHRRRPGNAPSRLVIFVDDLDRCAPKSIARTLDAIRLVLDLPGTIVIVALDERIGLRAVAQEYAALAEEDFDDEDIARDFLAKIIQLPVRLGAPVGIEDYVRQALFDRPAGASPTAATPQPGADQQLDRPEPHQAPATATAREGAPAVVDGRGADSAAGSAAGESPAFSGGREPTGSYGSATPAASTVVQREAMRENADEVEEFVRLTAAAGFTNPRQLRRIRNSYRFVKALNPTLDWGLLLVTMMWEELLHTLPEGIHCANLGRPRLDGAALDDTRAPRRLVEIVTESFESDEDFDRYRDAVLVTVLPRLQVAERSARPAPRDAALTS